MLDTPTSIDTYSIAYLGLGNSAPRFVDCVGRFPPLSLDGLGPKLLFRPNHSNHN